MEKAIILFTGISFIIYGVNSFYSRRMISEFKRWGYHKHRKTISSLQILGGLGLLIGLKINILLIASSLCLSIIMFVAIIVRVKINDNVVSEEKFVINQKLFQDNYLKLSIGKKRHIKVELT